MGILNSFYTDLVTIVRELDDNTGPITRKVDTIMYENIPCRIHKNPVTFAEQTKSNGEVLHNDKLSCDTSVDIIVGDKLIVIRGGVLNKSKTTETYIAGYPKIFYEPFANVAQGIDHQEVPLGGMRVV